MPRYSHPCPLLLAAAALLLMAPVRANDFPTTARVQFVLNCMQEGKASQQEMLYKCSCAVDAIAQQVPYDEWVDLLTLANATPIAGERGGALRDLKDGRKRITLFRELQATAKKACFIEK